MRRSVLESRFPLRQRVWYGNMLWFLPGVMWGFPAVDVGYPESAVVWILPVVYRVGVMSWAVLVWVGLGPPLATIMSDGSNKQVWPGEFYLVTDVGSYGRSSCRPGSGESDESSSSSGKFGLAPSCLVRWKCCVGRI